jgi:DNA-binding MarR family transcriptional regulator
MLILHNGVMEGDDLGYLIKRAQQALRNAIDPALSDLGLTTAQYAALYNLRRHPGASNAELARLSFVTPQTMVRIVAGLERAGLVSRTPSPRHRRVLQARLSTKGARVLGLAQRRVDAIHATMLRGIPPPELERLHGWLTHIAVTLEGPHDTAQQAREPSRDDLQRRTGKSGP